MGILLLGRKVGMTQVYDDAGVIHPVTVLAVGPCQVLQVKTPATDGYHAIQIGFEDKPRRKANQAETGRVKKINAEPKRFLREVRYVDVPPQQLGEMLNVGVFTDIPYVDVIANMKGRGFSGGMKRHGFAGLETGHGVQRKHRAIGSIGTNTSPGKVIRGHKMPGQYGNTRTTIRNLKVIRVDADNNCLLVEGGVPGPNGGLVVVRQSRKLRKVVVEEVGKKKKK